MNNMCCPISGINVPRFLIMTIAGFAFVFGFDFAVHHHLLMDLYKQTSNLWRPEETMGDYFPLMLGYQFLLVVVLGYIFTRNFEGKGIGEGLRFGLALGVLLGLSAAASYIWMPIPLELALSWAIAGLLQAVGLGVIYALLYKKGECCPKEKSE